MIHSGVCAVIGIVMLAGPAACNPTTIDDVARTVGKADDSAFKRRLTELNGGKTEVADDLAKQVKSPSAMVQKILNDNDQALSFACSAFSSGYDFALTPEGRRQLAAMKVEVNSGQATAEGIVFACKLREALNL